MQTLPTRPQNGGKKASLPCAPHLKSAPVSPIYWAQVTIHILFFTLQYHSYLPLQRKILCYYCHQSWCQYLY